MDIMQVVTNKKDYIDLLLIGDEQESAIERYLDRGNLFALYDEGLKTVAVVIREEPTICELKNLATYPCYQKRGYGTIMVDYLSQFYRHICRRMLVGTGENHKTIKFYEDCGFVYSHKIDNFFLENYDHKIFENGIQLVDMVYLEKDLVQEGK